VLYEYVRISEISDEREFYDTFAAHLSSAERSIWLWAPWTARRVASLLPVLADAVARGVAVRLFVRDPSDNLQGRPSSQAHLTDLRRILSTARVRGPPSI
jgi:phosphatidylserine/phosphatidylglycerophosphate/cardiolipin synthase-like enzyme